ncbi:MAG: M20/M25/M40 family metallo-hydrolase, partial [Nitrososphaerales archaeon]
LQLLVSGANKEGSAGPLPVISMDIKDATEAFEADKNSVLVRAMIRAGLSVRGKRPQLLRKTGTGDMNVLGNALDVPVVTFGPGDAHLSHTSEEFISVNEYRTSIELCLRSMNNFFEMHK